MAEKLIQEPTGMLPLNVMRLDGHGHKLNRAKDLTYVKNAGSHVQCCIVGTVDTR